MRQVDQSFQQHRTKDRAEGPVGGPRNHAGPRRLTEPCRERRVPEVADQERSKDQPEREMGTVAAPAKQQPPARRPHDDLDGQDADGQHEGLRSSLPDDGERPGRIHRGDKERDRDAARDDADDDQAPNAHPARYAGGAIGADWDVRDDDLRCGCNGRLQRHAAQAGQLRAHQFAARRHARCDRLPERTGPPTWACRPA
jgi:hypothetical protein